jgi:hypothetical protein
MKIVLDSAQQQESIQEQQQFVIIQSQSLTQKPTKMETSDGDEIVYVLKDENGSDQPVIQLDNTMNQDQYVWISNEQANDGTSQIPSASAIYTLKELNYSQVRSYIISDNVIVLTLKLSFLRI